jgi:PAS domain-containing protein
LELIHPDDREPLTKTIDSISSKGTSYELMVRLRTPTGSYRRLLFRGKPILNDDGELVEVYGVMIPQK